MLTHVHLSYAAGTYAEYYAAKESDIAEMPASVSFQEAAGIPLASLTAYQVTSCSCVNRSVTCPFMIASHNMGASVRPPDSNHVRRVPLLR